MHFDSLQRCRDGQVVAEFSRNPQRNVIEIKHALWTITTPLSVGTSDGASRRDASFSPLANCI
jgi:hypothetical protein